MANGIQIHNDSGDVLIDGTYRNYKPFLIGSQFQPMPPGLGGHSRMNYVQFPERPGLPLLAVQPGSDTWALGGAFSPNDSSVAFFTKPFHTALPYVLMDEDGGPPEQDTHGVQVFDEEGRPVFDSRHRYLRVRDILRVRSTELPMEGDAGFPLVLDHAWTPNAYYTVSTLGGYRHISLPNLPDGRYYVPGIRQVSPGQCQMGLLIHAAPNLPVTRDYFPEFQLVLVCELSP